MRVLLIGGGGREHALAWKIAQSPRLEHLWAAPGNPGIARHARCLDLRADDADGLAGFARGHAVDLVVVGPEAPLVAGLGDRLRADGLAVFGPGAAAAAIEGSKAFAKALMARAGVPTARFSTFDDPAAARRFCRELGAPLVVKADGLAAGKGAIVCASLDEADTAIAQCMERREFGAAGTTVVVEEFMHGEEASFFALVSDKVAVPLDAAQDHKTVFDDDRGPNTGGMGAFAPAPPIDERMQTRVMREIVEPTVAALATGGAPYRGVLYVGLMLTKDGPKVVEFNCRFGDPEAQPVMLRLCSDLPELCLAALDGRLDRVSAEWDTRAALGVVMAAHGYPDAVRDGDVIHGLDAAARLPGKVFHSGTALEHGRVVTHGGRVLCAVGLGANVAAARQQAYALVDAVRFDGAVYRRDIGHRALERGM